MAPANPAGRHPGSCYVLARIVNGVFVGSPPSPPSPGSSATSRITTHPARFSGFQGGSYERWYHRARQGDRVIGAGSQGRSPDTAVSLFLSFTVLGIVAGATFAMSASGLVVTYATTGVFNFAHGAVGMVCCFTFWELAYNDTHSTMPVWLALALVILVEAPLLGIIIERVFMRRLHGASTVRSLMVTLGMLLILLGMAEGVWSARDDAEPAGVPHRTSTSMSRT